MGWINGSSYTRELWNEINKGPVIKQNINLNEPLKNIRGKIIPIPEYYLIEVYVKKLNGYEDILVNNSWNLKRYVVLQIT